MDKQIANRQIENRQINRQIENRQISRQIGKTDKQINRYLERQTGRQMERQLNIYTIERIYRETMRDRKTDKIDRQIFKNIYIYSLPPHT